MDYVLIKDITPDYHNWCLKVRVVRFREYLGDEQPPEVRRLDFIMLDEKGQAMEGQIPQRLLDRHRPRLAEGSIYYIKAFEVAPARPRFRPVDHPYLGKFTAYTRVTPAHDEPPNFPQYACTLSTYDELEAKHGHNFILSDAIGLFERCSGVDIVTTKHGQRPMRNVFITNGRKKAKVALWSQLAYEFDADKYMELAKTQPVVFLFCGVTPGAFGGILALQASPICRWYADPDLPETTLLKNSFGHTVNPVQAAAHHPQQQDTGVTTVSSLALLKDPHQVIGHRYNLAVKVKSIHTNQSWWYNACDICKRKTRPNGDKYKCGDPLCTGIGCEPRYCLSFVGEDPEPTDEAAEHTIEMVCFGPTAEELIGIAVEALIEQGGGVGLYTPHQITRLQGRKYEVRVSVPRGSLQRERISFKIDSVISMAMVPDGPQMPATNVQPNIEAPGSASPVTHTLDNRTPSPDATDTGSTEHPSLGTPPPAPTPEAESTSTKRGSASLPPPSGASKAATGSDTKRSRKGSANRKLVLNPEEEDA